MTRLQTYDDGAWGKIPTSLTPAAAAADPTASSTATQAAQSANQTALQAQGQSALPPPPLPPQLQGTPLGLWLIKLWMRSGGSSSGTLDDVSLLASLQDEDSRALAAFQCVSDDLSILEAVHVTRAAYGDDPGLWGEVSFTPVPPQRDYSLESMLGLWGNTPITTTLNGVISGSGTSTITTSFTNGSTGSGAVVLQGTPSLTTPDIGAATGASVALTANSTVTANTSAILSFTVNNTSNGTAASSRWIALNDTNHQIALAMFGSGSTSSVAGVTLAEYAALITNSSAGLVIAPTVASKPIIIGAGTTEYFRWDTSGHGNIADAKNLILGSTTGTKIGTATTQKLGFWNATPVVKQTVTGSRGGNAALASLLTALATAGLVVDSSSA